MRNIFILCCVLFTSPFCASAHQLDFYGKCNRVPLPDCGGGWNNMTSSDSALYVVGDNGACFISFHNGGIKSINTGTPNNLTGVQFISNTIGYAWGTQGTLLKTLDAGINWQPINTDTSSTIDKVQFVDVDHGFFMAGSIISKTNNGGVTWTKIILPLTVPITDFYFFDSLNGQICGGKLSPSALGYLYKTNNGGSTWNQVYSDTIYFKKLFYVNDSAGYVYGISNTNPILIATIDTGSVWNIEYSNTSWTLVSNVIHFKDQTAFVSNEAGNKYIYGTPDFNTPDGIVTGALNIHSSKNNGVEMLYILSANGLYRYINGGIIFYNIDFFNGITPNVSNPSNTLSPGSKVRFKVSIYNVFLSTLINLNGKIRCSSPYITIIDSIGSFKNVQSHTFAWNKDVFEIQLANNIPDNYVPQFELMIGDPLQAGGTWNSIFSFPIVFSPFTISDIVIDDDSIANSIGNNNDIVEPDETAEIIPFADNTTNHTFLNMEGYLFSERNEINIWKDTLGFTDTVRNHYYYGSFAGMTTNIQPVEKFVFTNNFTDTFNLPLIMVFTGNINSFKIDGNGCNIYEYNTITYRWATNFFINDGSPVPVDIKEFEGSTNKKYSLFPNPCDGKFTLRTNVENAKIQIRDLMGNQIYQSYLGQNNSIFIDISAQPIGIYFLEIISDKGKETIKMIRL